MENPTLRDLGWSPFLQSILAAGGGGTPVRVAAVHRTAVDVLSPDGAHRLALAPWLSAAEVAVGDWLAVDGPPGDGGRLRLLERQSLLARRAAGTGAALQLIAANVDTLFVVTSCNADFNPARIERYLALAHQSRITPVIVLTKADLCADPGTFADRARLIAAVAVEVVDARNPGDVARLGAWSGPGETVALAGMSGVGKSTLASALTGEALATAAIREDDARGRHTTTVRSLHRTRGGGWLIDTPGMRALRLAGAEDGIAAVFDDVDALAAACRFGDCRHEGEPGCAVRAAIDAGTLDPARLERWRRLVREDARNSATLAEARAADRAFKRMTREAMAGKRQRREE